MEKIGFIGIGTMGFPICYGLFKKGYKIVLPTFRREIDQSSGFIPLVPDEKSKASKIDEMLSNGCDGSDSIVDLSQKSDVIMISMPTSKQVEAITLGENGIESGAKSGTVIIDLTSADPTSTKMLSKRLSQKGIELLDSPISGGHSHRQQS